jgi:hypothetical protein
VWGELQEGQANPSSEAKRQEEVVHYFRGLLAKST